MTFGEIRGIICPILASAKDYGKAKDNRTRWDDIKHNYRNTKTDRLIFVKYKGKTSAALEMWEKVSAVKAPSPDMADGTALSEDEGITAAWKKIVSCKAYVGANGLGKKREGDKKTPVGIYNVTMAFGRKRSPGTAGISYTKLNKYHYWSSERDSYNRFVDVRTQNRTRMDGEHLISCDPWYNYALALDYNRRCVYPKGSAIFLHCFGGKNAYTMGCIVVSEESMKQIVRHTTEHTKICIFKK